MNAQGKCGQHFYNRDLSRRVFLRLGAAAGIGFTGGLGGLSFRDQVDAQTSAQVEKPQYGGTLAYRLGGDPPNFDMISNATYMNNHPMSPIYNNLVIYDPLDPHKIIGELAEKWEISPDGKIYTFHLVKGVKFHDGKPCTAADVKFTFDLIRNPPQGTISLRKVELTKVDGIELVDDYTVRFILKRPSASFLAILAGGYMAILPKHVIEEKGDMKKDAIGTGPLKLRKYIRGVSIELVRNPDYHVKGRPFLDGITYFIIPDPGTAFAHLRTGQLHFYMMSGDEARQAEKEFGNKVVIQRSAQLTFGTLNFNTNQNFESLCNLADAVDLSSKRRLLE